VQVLGVSGALIFLPAGLSIGTLFMFLTPGLGAAVFSRLVDGSLKQSLHRAGVEMLFLPVSREVKERIKTYIDVFIDSVAGGLGGLLLLLLVEGLGFTPELISAPILFLVIGWLICVLLVREEYLEAFRGQLSSLRPKHLRGGGLQSKHKELVSGFLNALAEETADEDQLLYILDRAEEIKDDRFKTPVRRLLTHNSPAIRARALQFLSILPDEGLLEWGVKLLDDDDPRVKNAALEYLVAHHLTGAETLIDRQLEHPDSSVAGAALRHLFFTTRANPALRRRWKLDERFQNRKRELDELPKDQQVAWTVKLLEAAGAARSNEGNAFIGVYLQGAEPTIVKAAIQAAGQSANERWLSQLIDFLGDPIYRASARAALVKYGLGFVSVLPGMIRNESIAIDDIRRITRVLERINSQQSVELLFDLLKRYYPNDLALRLEVLKSLNAMRRDFPKLGMPSREIFRLILDEVKTYQQTIENLYAQSRLLSYEKDKLREARRGLLNLLEQRQKGNLDRLFRLLGLRYQPTDIIPIYRGLLSADRQQRINAVEFLDNLLESPFKRLLIPLLEYRAIALDELPDESDLATMNDAQYRNFRRILSGRDNNLKLPVLYLIGYLKDERYVSLLQYYTKDSDERVRDVASRALTSYRRSVFEIDKV
ncbi:MAG: HEAT repeat domain-containing protein, partial [Bacteroidota bacterium]